MLPFLLKKPVMCLRASHHTLSQPNRLLSCLIYSSHHQNTTFLNYSNQIQWISFLIKFNMILMSQWDLLGLFSLLVHISFLMVFHVFLNPSLRMRYHQNVLKLRRTRARLGMTSVSCVKIKLPSWTIWPTILLNYKFRGTGKQARLTSFSTCLLWPQILSSLRFLTWIRLMSHLLLMLPLQLHPLCRLPLLFAMTKREKRKRKSACCSYFILLLLLFLFYVVMFCSKLLWVSFGIFMSWNILVNLLMYEICAIMNENDFMVHKNICLN